ncbi:MAG: hypothetical protein AAB267_05435, partial [Candidatus Desantisbacteria bacterium]
NTITIHFGTSCTITTTTSQNGTFSVSFITDTQPYGTVVVTAQGSAGGNVTTVFVILSNITQVIPSAARVGDTVTVFGNGYPNGTVTIHFGSHQTITTGTANPNGTFSITFIVSTQEYGSHTITANGKDIGSEDTIAFTILPKVYLVLPPSGPVGTIVTVKGTGYISELNALKIKFGTADESGFIAGSVVGNNGTFSITFVIDTQPGGTTVVTIREVSGVTIDATNIFYLTGSITTVNPTNGRVYETITIQGTGFDGAGTVTIDFGTHQTITTILSSSNGTFSVTFIADIQPKGPKVITASTSPTKQSSTAVFELMGAYINFISPSPPSSGPVGQIVTIAGVGFHQYATVTVHFGTHYTITTTPGNLNGTFSVTFCVDTQPSCTKVITAWTTDGSTYEIATTTFKIHGAYITLVSPTSGPVGQEVTVEGVGFDGT